MRALDDALVRLAIKHAPATIVITNVILPSISFASASATDTVGSAGGGNGAVLSESRTCTVTAFELTCTRRWSPAAVAG